jgi:predicted CDP-diglyceride synthetase/phosphatidate cytidylyltransferase
MLIKKNKRKIKEASGFLPPHDGVYDRVDDCVWKRMYQKLSLPNWF